MTVCAETSDKRERRLVAAARSVLSEKGIAEERQCKRIAMLFCFE